MLLLQLALRNLRRNTRRSTLTILAVVLGTGILTLGLAWLNGVTHSIFKNAADQAGQVRIATPDFVQREARMPLYENLAETDPIVAAVQEVPGVAAYPVIRTLVMASLGEALGDTSAPLQGAPLAYYRDVLDLGGNLVSGRVHGEDPGEAVLGRAVAQELKASVGDELVVLGQTQDGSISPLKLAVVGIAALGNGVGDKLIYVPLERARWLADIPEGGVEVLVFGDDDRDAAALAAQLRSLPALAGLSVQAWMTREPYSQLSQTLTKVVGAVALIIVLVTAMVVLNTMLMSVMERTGEVGVLRAMGMKRRSTVALFVLEAAFLGGAGSALGVVLGSIPAIALQIHGVDLGNEMTAKLDVPVNTVMHALHTPQIAVFVFLLGYVIALVGSAVPALRAASIQPVEAMRSKQ